MTGYLIDPVDGTMRAVELSDRTLLRELYSLLKCDTVEVVYLALPTNREAGVACYCDENARIRNDPPRGEFVLLRDDGTWSDPILGRGMLVGFNSVGQEVSVPLLPHEAAARVRYGDRVVNG